MTGRFDGEVVVVTGGGNGLGRAYALLLASEGARVVVNDVRGASAVVAEIEAAGGEALADDADVRSATAVALAVDAFGRLDAVVNNAGIGGGGAFDDIAPEDFQEMLDVHLGGTLAVCRAAWPVLRAAGGGRIVNTSSASVFGIVGTSAYVTAKAAVFGLTRAIAAEGRRLGIRVNAVMPTAFSQMTARSPHMAPLLEEGFPAEAVAPFVAALASRAVPVIGETFVVGGGRAARVVFGTTPGATGITSVDDALARFADVMASDDVFLPRDSLKAVLYECERLGIDASGFGF